MFLAWNEMKHSKLRYGLVVGVIFLIAYLVFFLTGLANGLAQTNVLLLSGTLFYANVEHFTYLDALYFSFTTLTTIGYGDIYPVTAAGKIFTMMYSVVGLGVMGSFLAVVVKKLGQLDKKK